MQAQRQRNEQERFVGNPFAEPLGQHNSVAKKKKKPAKKKKKGKSYYMNAPDVELEEQFMAQENIDPQSDR